MNACNFQVLAEGPGGYAVYCQDCRTIQLAFGTTMLKLRPDHFQEILDLMRLETAARPEAGNCNVKNIVIPVDDCTMICLTRQELGKVELLLSEAAVMFETWQILEG